MVKIKTETETYRIIRNLTWKGIIIGAGEKIPEDLVADRKALQDFIVKGNICAVDSVTGENIDTLHKDPMGRLVLSDAEILNLKPDAKTLNFLKRNKLCESSLRKLQDMLDEATLKYGIPNNFFISSIYEEINRQLELVR